MGVSLAATIFSLSASNEAKPGATTATSTPTPPPTTVSSTINSSNDNPWQVRIDHFTPPESITIGRFTGEKGGMHNMFAGTADRTYFEYLLSTGHYVDPSSHEFRQGVNQWLAANGITDASSVGPDKKLTVPALA